jgi:mono/diheme cytochrome c family protein
MIRLASRSHAPRVAIALALFAVAMAEDTATRPASGADSGAERGQRFLRTYCSECHGPVQAKGGVRLDHLASPITSENLAQWDDVATVVSSGSMPAKAAATQPTDEDRDRLLAWLAPALERFRAERLDSGGDTQPRRINHRAYRNMIHTLLGVPPHGVDEFPADNASNGFDTVGSGLYLTADLYQRYLDSARRTVDIALDGSAQAPPVIEKTQRCRGDIRWYGLGAPQVALKGLIELTKQHPEQMKGEAFRKVVPNGIFDSDSYDMARGRVVDAVVAHHYGAGSIAEVEAKGIDWPADAHCMEAIAAGLQHELEVVQLLEGAYSDFQQLLPEDVDHMNQSFMVEVKDPGYYLVSAQLCCTNEHCPMPARLEVDFASVRTFMIENGPSTPRTCQALVYLEPGKHRVGAESPFPFVDNNLETGHYKYVLARYGFNAWAQHPGGIKYNESPAVLAAAAEAGTWCRFSLRSVDTFPALLGSDVTVRGPIHDAWPPPAVATIFTRGLSAPASTEYAQQIVSTLLRRISAGAPQAKDVRSYTDLIMAHYQAQHDFVAAVKYGVAAVLSSPRFLFLEESRRSDPKRRRPLSGPELARRLAYALWSDVADEPLITSAESGRLTDHQELLAQVHRMLADTRSGAFRAAFTTQWLKIDHVKSISVERTLFPVFDERLLDSAIEESVAFFSEILDHDLSVMTFIDSDFVMINSRLADHYGIAGVHGDEIRRVTLPPGSHRGGVMGQASVLIATGNGMITSPVRRGALLMERLLGVPPGVPPRNVPPLDRSAATGADGRPLTARQRLALHRADHGCARCHDRIDPLGLAFEQYTAIGGFSPTLSVLPPPVNGKPQQWVACPADVAGTTLDGTGFDGPDQLKLRLFDHPEPVVRCLVRNLTVYLLGRGLEPSDEPVLARICADVEQHGCGLARMLDDILTSDLFVDK